MSRYVGRGHSRGRGGRGRGGGGGRGGGRFSSTPSSGFLFEDASAGSERLAQSASFVTTDTVTRQFVPNATDVMAVAKPFSASNVYDAKGKDHVPICEGQNTAQNLQAALALMYRNASIVMWNQYVQENKAIEAHLDGENADMTDNQVITTVINHLISPPPRRPAFLSVPLWMAQGVSVIGTIELLIHTVDRSLRDDVFSQREGKGAGFLTADDIERVVKRRNQANSINNVFGEGPDPPEADTKGDGEEKEPEGDSELDKARLLLSLTPVEAANYLIHGGSMSALDPGNNACACEYVGRTIFALKRHYFLYAGTSVPMEQKVDLDVPMLFSLPNALTILLKRTGAHSVVCSAPGRDIRTAVDLINAVYQGPSLPSEKKAREAHDLRAIALASENAEELVTATHRLNQELKALQQERKAYVAFAERVRQERGNGGLVPQFSSFSPLVRDLYEDIRLTRLDPAKLVRIFCPASSSASVSSQSPHIMELKQHMFAQRRHLRETIVDPLIARLSEMHMSPEAHDQFLHARRLLLPTVLALLDRSYPEPMPECKDVLRELRPLLSPENGINPVLAPIACLETHDMSASDNLQMHFCRLMRANNLEANAASWAVTCQHLIMSTSLTPSQARENFVLSGPHAAGKTYNLKEIVKLLFGVDLMVEARTDTSFKSGTNTIWPDIDDEGTSGGVVNVWDLLKRRGQYGVYDTSNETRDRKATMSQQEVKYSKNDFTDAETGQKRNKPIQTVKSANRVRTTNFPGLLGTDQAIGSRERDANPLSALGTTETHIPWLPESFDDVRRFKAWSEMRQLNHLMFFAWHCRASGVYRPAKSDTALMIAHGIVSSLTSESENAFGELFSAEAHDDNRHAIQSAHMGRLRDNLDSNDVRSLMFQFAEMIPDPDETANYYQRRKALERIQGKLHEGVPTIAFTRNDSVSLLTQRDTRYIRSLIETLEYESAMLHVFHNNAVGANFTTGSMFDRMQLVEDAHQDQTVEDMIKGLQSCSWLDVRIIDGALALLALYCEASAQELSPILPDEKGLIVLRRFFDPLRPSPLQASSSASSSASASANRKKNAADEKQAPNDSRDYRIFYFFRRLNQVFPRPIWETKMANEMLMLLMFVRVVGSNHPLLDYRNFDDRNTDNYDLVIDSRVFLYGHFASMVNTKISASRRPISSLGFHSTLERNLKDGTYRCSPPVYSFEARVPAPDSLPLGSMWRHPVNRAVLFRESKSSAQNRITDDLKAMNLVRSASAPVIEPVHPRASPKRTLSEHSDEEDQDALIDEHMRDIEEDLRGNRDDDGSESSRKVARAMFVPDGNNFQPLQLQPIDPIPHAAAQLLNLVEASKNPRACYIFHRLVRVSHIQLNTHSDELESPEFKQASQWRAAFRGIDLTASQRTNFMQRLESALDKLRTEAKDQIASVNNRTRPLAARISRLASVYPVSQPLRMGMSSDFEEIQWLDVEHLSSPFGCFPPVKAHEVWRNLILERTKYAHYPLSNSQLVYQKNGILLDADLRDFEREQRLHRLYPQYQLDRMWCHRANLATNMKYQAQILHLVSMLDPVFRFQAAVVSDESVDEALYFHDILPVDVQQGTHVARIFTHSHPPQRDAVNFLADARTAVTASPVFVPVYKRLLREALLIFFDYMCWKATLQGLLCVTVDADLCHYTAASMGLVYCTRIVDYIAKVVTSPDLLSMETRSNVTENIVKWIDEVILETAPERNDAVDQFTMNQQAVDEFPYSTSALSRAVFVPHYEDFPLKPETIIQRFASYVDFAPIVAAQPRSVAHPVGEGETGHTPDEEADDSNGDQIMQSVIV